MPRVFVVGSINQDIVVSVARAPGGGETVPGTSLTLFPGGKGANQAVAAAVMGCEVEMVGRVGSDAFAQPLIDNLHERGVKPMVKIVRGESTGAAVIVVDESGENRIAVVAGANAALNTEAVADLEDLSRKDVVLLQNEIPLETTRSVLAFAKTRHAVTLFNVAPPVELTSDDFVLIDYLVANEHEFEVVFDTPLASLADRDGICRQVVEMSKKFSMCIVVTLGAGGAVCAVGEDLFDIDGIPATAVDTTGAGDCFVGVLAAGLVSGMTLEESLLRANAAAAISVQRPGASASFPTMEELKGTASKQDA